MRESYRPFPIFSSWLCDLGQQLPLAYDAGGLRPGYRDVTDQQRLLARPQSDA